METAAKLPKLSLGAAAKQLGPKYAAKFTMLDEQQREMGEGYVGNELMEYLDTCIRDTLTVPVELSLDTIAQSVRLVRPSVKLVYISPREYCSKAFFNEQKTVPLLQFHDESHLDFRFLNVENKTLSEKVVSTIAANNIAALVGVSGCGKTSSGFNYASSRFVLYFEAPYNGRFGSPDFRYASDTIISTVRGLPESDRIARAVSLWKCYFSARALYLSLLLDTVSDLTPQAWLLMQLPIFSPNINPNQAMFQEVNEIFKKLITITDINGTSDRIFEELSAKQRQKVVVFLDEAQMLAAKEATYTRSNLSPRAHDPFRRPLSIVVQAVAQLHTPLMLAGTKLRLKDLETVASGASKLGVLESNPKVCPVTEFPFFTRQEARINIQKIFTTSAETMVTIDLSGRARFWASFVLVLLMRASNYDQREVLMEACCRDFTMFHVHGRTSLPPLEDQSRSMKAHFESHLAKNSTSQNKSKNLHSQLSDLVAGALLGMGSPRLLSKDDANWVAGGICFLHEAAPGQVKLSCQEPLVLSAIIQAIQGRDTIIETIKECMRSSKAYLGNEDTSKGTLLQHLTTARLLQLCFRAPGERAMTLGNLLTMWGMPQMKNPPAWLPAHWNSPIELNRVTKDKDGKFLISMLEALNPGAILMASNAARVEYTGLLGGVLVTAACKFYGRTKKTREVVVANRWTTDISNVYITDDGTVKSGFETLREKTGVALKNFFTKPNAPAGTIRLMFSVMEKFETQLFEVQTVDRGVLGVHQDLLITFTRSNIATVFFANPSIASLLESYYSAD